MLLSGGLIGLIRLRTFSQQGMFILGGTLADRYGAKAIILAGCVVRVAGFLAGVRGVAVAHYPRRLPDRRRRRPVLPVDRGPAGAGRYPQPPTGNAAAPSGLRCLRYAVNWER